jgi:murein DD-endopeptidase MepM/ murein hydrolase activator NlpD
MSCPCSLVTGFKASASERQIKGGIEMARIKNRIAAILMSMAMLIAALAPAQLAYAAADNGPVGYVDVIEAVNGGRQVRVAGWAYDPDSPSVSVGVHVYTGGEFGANFTANKESGDVNRAMGVTGSHRFDYTLDVKKSGAVHIYGINVQNSGNGLNNLLSGNNGKNVSLPSSSPSTGNQVPAGAVKTLNGQTFAILYTNTNQGINVQYANYENGKTNIVLDPVNDAQGFQNNERWSFELTDDGASYYIIPIDKPGSVLDLDANGVSSDSARVQIWTRSTANNQRWYVIADGSNYRIASKASWVSSGCNINKTQLLGSKDGKTGTGNQIIASWNIGSSNQVYRLVAPTSGGGSKIQYPVANPSKNNCDTYKNDVTSSPDRYSSFFNREHMAWDYGSNCGTDIFSIADGEVVNASKFSTSYGNRIIVKSTAPNGTVFYTLYAHLNTFAVTSGKVSAGQKIATMGSSGKTGGTQHLHIAVWTGSEFNYSSASGLKQEDRSLGFSIDKATIGSQTFYSIEKLIQTQNLW